MAPAPNAQHYTTMKDGVEGPEARKPVSQDAIRARKMAVREGRLRTPSRDELRATMLEASRMAARVAAAGGDLEAAGLTAQEIHDKFKAAQEAATLLGDKGAAEALEAAMASAMARSEDPEDD